MESRTWWWIGGGAVVLALILFFAFSGDDEGDDTTTIPVAADSTTTSEAMEDTTTTSEAMESTTTSEAPPAVEAIKACQVTDTGGIDDKSFNQTAWKGVTDAQAAGLATDDSKFLESQSAADYEPNIQSLIDDGCDLIVTVGFLLGADTETMANANPDQFFQIIDFAYDPTIPNVQGAVFGTTDAAFLAGYLAAGMSETGVVATYGGIQIPCAVTCFMDGFYFGVMHYNDVKGTSVEVLGWDPATSEGAFTGDFEDLAKGRALTQQFVDEGADVILPVAGPVGEGSAALAQELGNVWVIGVDADWFQTLPQYENEILTSVLKGLDVAVSTAISDVANGVFEGGTRLYAIAEDGVGIGSINPSVPQELQDEVATILEGLKDGSIVPGA